MLRLLLLIVVLIGTRTLLALTLDPTGADTLRYAAYTQRLFLHELPFVDFTLEYPPWTLVLMVLPAFISASLTQYVIFFRLQMALFEIALVVVLVRVGRRHLGLTAPTVYASAALYLLLSSLGAYFLLDRLDLAVALLLLLSGAFALDPRRASWASAIVVLAISLKVVAIWLVPVVLLAIWHRQRTIRALGTGLAQIVAFGLLFNLPFLVYAGFDVIDFASYHAERGMQVESTYASALMLFGRSPFAQGVAYHHGAAHLVSVATGIVQSAGPVIMALSQLGLIALAAAAVRRATPTELGPLVMRIALAALLTFLMTSWVLSPQFLLWVYPLAALTLAVDRWPRIDLAMWIVVAALTSVLYPLIYESLLRMEILPRGLLFLRNGLLAALTVRQWIAIGRPLTQPPVETEVTFETRRR